MRMTMRTVALPSPSGFLFEPDEPRRLLYFLGSAAPRVGSWKICSTLSQPVYPKRNGFNRNSIDRIYEELPYIQKTKKEIADHCLTLEGDACLSCWRAYSELHDLERELPKREVENTITLSSGDGIESMISSLHHFSATHRRLKEESNGSTNALNEAKMVKETSGSAPKAFKEEKAKEEPKYVPEWMPKSIEELEEEEKARMADSPHARLLRAIRVHPRWYTPPHDHKWGD